ncbi:putative ABC transporter [Aspergillus steynii IBT 23096]|uniref:Putative ABC transporter n=1 Tax=Aspergillus steynii IBT 23096 TaxID=1392250 RepID=A0A2I2GBQ2_9EURO|nr:putative ABC transporter [Aspergillus steynii IBT 23096]PLB50306.1 putative ABC transporter [Aspergillus steynii IBT 23096]
MPTVLMRSQNLNPRRRRIFTFCDRLDILLYGIGLTAAIVSGASLPLMTIIFGNFTSDFTEYASGPGSGSSGLDSPQSFSHKVDTFTLWFVYLFIGRFIISYIATETVSIAAVRVTRTIRRTFLATLLRQEVERFDNDMANGSPSSQVTTNGIRINQGIAEKLAILVQAISMFFSAFIVALVVQWKLALITACIIPAIVIVAIVSITIDIGFEIRIVRIHSQAAVLAQQVLSSVKTVHAFWAQEKLIKQYDQFLIDARKLSNKKSPNIGLANAVFYFSMYGGTALAFWQGFRMFASGEIGNVGTVLTVILSINIGASSMSVVAPQLGVITNASAAAAELFETIDRESKVDPLSEEGECPSTCEGNLEVRNLAFAYPSRPSAPALRGLNLSIPAGKTTALVGASGCGKSTIVGLLERWYLPDSGEILLDNRNIADYNIKWLRSQIRIVQQEPILFRGTVFENIAKGLVGSQLELPLEQKMKLVQDACRLSNAHDFIEKLPQGYQTQVGERASMLSGGQKQRLVIARSVISDPQILLLDEATSALDPRSEGIVQEALNKVSVNKTTLIIAHKLSTIQSADNIVVISHGEVVEQGTHNELLALNGQYAALVQAQDLGDVAEGPLDGVFEGNDDQGQNDMASKLPEITMSRSSLDISEPDHNTSHAINYSLFKCLFIMIREQKDVYHWMALLVFACLIAGGSYPAQAIIYSRLINVFALPPQAAQGDANFFALMFFIFALINMGAYLVIGWVGNVVGQKITHRYRLEMFQRVLNLDLDFFDEPENSSGSLTSKLSSMPNAIQDLIAQGQFVLLVCMTNIFASCILAIAYGWKLGLVVVFAGMPVLRDTSERFTESAALATEAVTSIRTLASLTLEKQICSEYDASLDHIAKSALKTITWASLGYALSQSLDYLLMALGFWYGSRLIASGEYSNTQFFVVFLSVLFGGQAAGQIFALLATLATAHVAANYVLWLRTLKASISENGDNFDTGPPGNGDLQVKDVMFRYKRREASPVLNGINMTITPGSYTACVGASGCGKSTLIALLERFYDPTSGCITMGDVNITTLSPRLYRASMSLVQQHPTLYNGSIRDNILLGLQYEPTDEEILDACREAAAFDFISSLPEGLSTSCGSEGLQFSGGQRQRIAIARSLIRKPRLLLLDEATSALDTQSEKLVQNALDRAASWRTTIAVAHRLSTIRHADMILVFSDGKIIERGTHDQLQHLKGQYYEMCLAQSFGDRLS